MFRNMELLESEDSEYMLILSGDHIYEMDYRDLLAHHIQTEADLTIAAIEHPLKEASSFGVIEVDTNFRVTGFAEKPATPVPLPSRPSMALVSMGIYVFRKNVLLKTLLIKFDQTSAPFGTVNLAQAGVILDMKKRMAELTAEQTGKSVEQILIDNDRDN